MRAAIDVTSDASGRMRDNAFSWPRTLQRSAVAINGTFPGVLDNGGALHCPLSGKAYQCFSAKMAVFNTPSILKDKADANPFMLVPFIGKYYSADVIIKPPRGMPCSAVEVYRLTLDGSLNVEHGLDYPASSLANASSGAMMTTSAKCGVFGDPAWCLSFGHSFSYSDYIQKVTAKCSIGDGQLVIRLPQRTTADVDPITGRMGHDILLVTSDASVQMRWVWHSFGTKTPLLTSWEQTASAYNDPSQSWRDSSDAGSVFIKYAIAVLPLQILWYYLTVSLRKIVQDYQACASLFFVHPSFLI